LIDVLVESNLAFSNQQIRKKTNHSCMKPWPIQEKLSIESWCAQQRKQFGT